MAAGEAPATGRATGRRRARRGRPSSGQGRGTGLRRRGVRVAAAARPAITGDAVRTVAPRILNRQVYHIGSPAREVLYRSYPAATSGRYHQKGDGGAWYASFRERGAWAELFRHHDSPEISPFEVRRRVGRARAVGLKVLDLTDATVQETLGVTAHELEGDEYAFCRAIAAAARAAGLDGVLGPSGALGGETTLVVFEDAIRAGKLRVEDERVQRPPRSMVAYLEFIRVRSAASRAIRVLYRRLARRMASDAPESDA